MEKTDHDILVELRSALLGVNGQDGLLKSHKDLARDYYTFKRWVITITAFLVGSGALGVGIMGLLKNI